MIFKRVEKSINMKPLIERKRMAEPPQMLQNMILTAPPAVITPVVTTLSESSYESDKATPEKVVKNCCKKATKKEPKAKRQIKAQSKRSDSEEYKSVSTAPKSNARGTRRRTKVKTMEEVTGLSREEEKMLTIAMKNSLREQQASPEVELHEIEEMKTYRPSEDEFKDPIKYVEQLYKEGASEYG